VSGETILEIRCFSQKTAENSLELAPGCWQSDQFQNNKDLTVTGVLLMFLRNNGNVINVCNFLMQTLKTKKSKKDGVLFLQF